MKMQSKALLITGANKLEYEKVMLHPLGDYEVLFHTMTVSLCTVDRRAYMGIRKYSYPFLGGHECCGIIEEVGRGVVDLKPGDYAVFTGAFCLQCELDRTGKSNQCKNKKEVHQRVNMEHTPMIGGSLLGGGLSEYITIPAWQVIKFPKELPFEWGALTEPLACTIHSIRKSRIQMGETVLIIGFGIMGYFHLALAQMMGARVIVSDPSEKKRKMALEFGAYDVIDPIKEPMDSKIQTITNGVGVDCVFYTIPDSSAFTKALKSLTYCGRCIIYSSQNDNKSIDINLNEIHIKEIEIIGTVNSNLNDNNTAIHLIQQKRIQMDPVISGIYPFEKGVEAFEKACQPNLFRIILSYLHECEL